jgi:hypothetical protein
MEHAAPERYIRGGFCSAIESYMATRQPLVEIYPALDSASIQGEPISMCRCNLSVLSKWQRKRERKKAIPQRGISHWRKRNRSLHFREWTRRARRLSRLNLRISTWIGMIDITDSSLSLSVSLSVDENAFNLRSLRVKLSLFNVYSMRSAAGSRSKRSQSKVYSQS